jgi:hypothetical protein
MVASCLDQLPHNEYNNNICKRTEAPRIAIIGDSHAGHLFEGFLASGDAAFSQVMAVGRGSCPPVLGVATLPGCNDVLESALALIEQTPTVDDVLLAAYYAAEFKDAPKEDIAAQEALFQRGYGAMISRLAAAGKRVWFVKDVPTLDFNPAACVKRPLRLPYSSHAECSLPLSKLLTQRAEYDRVSGALATAHPGLGMLETRDVFCDDQACRAVIDGRVQFKDFNHLSDDGSRRLAAVLVSRMRTEHAKRP